VTDVVPQRYAYRARASWGDTVVAESDACLLVQEDGVPATLWFPESDIDRGSLGDAGESVLSTSPDTSGPLAPLLGHAAFDTDRVCVEVFDRDPGDESGGALLRFPTWGDTSDLVAVMDVRPEGAARYTGAARSDGRRPVVEGSQMLGQAIVAAGREHPDRRVVSASMMFLKGADARRPLGLEMTELSVGRTFAGLDVQVFQEQRRCAAGTLLLHSPAPAVVTHAVDPPDVPGPGECPPCDMGVTGRELRVVDGAYTDDPAAPPGPPLLDCWVRFRQLPDDPVLHAGLLAQFTGHMPIAAALRPHQGIGQAQAHRTLSMGINAINLSLHHAVRADEWMLYHHQSTFAGDGMTHAECRVFTEAGVLLASFTVDAMVRPFAEHVGAASRDERTAL
jgi:acyl-CoA thioesterase II